MSELTTNNSLEVHEAWLQEARQKLKAKYGDTEKFSKDNNINYLSTFWFFKGNPVVDTDFRNICNVLGLDWEAIQQNPSN